MKIDSDVLLVIPIRQGYSGITLDLGLLYLYSALKDRHIDSTILHCPKDSTTQERWEEILMLNPQLKIIGFKAFSVDHNSIKRMASSVKKILPGCTTIIGGPHPSSLSEYILNDISDLDFAFEGEGEIGFPQFCKCVLAKEDISEVPGLVYRTEKGFKHNQREIISDLDDLPRVRWEDINIDEYPDFMTSLPFIPVMATRGCPYHCTYCATSTIVGRRMRFRSVENVLTELRLLRDVHGVRGINFSDDELTLNRKYFKRLCEELIKSDLNIKWECSNGIRLDTIDEEVLALMYRAGCRYAAVGIESASDEILKKIKKKINTKTIREQVNLIKKSQIIPQGLFMIGFPGETEAEIEKTIDFAIELDIDKTNFSIFMPLPGTESFDDLIENGYLNLEKMNWDNMKPDRVIFERPGVSGKILKKMQKKAYLKFYFRPKPLIRIFQEFVVKDGGLKALFSKAKSIFNN